MDDDTFDFTATVAESAFGPRNKHVALYLREPDGGKGSMLLEWWNAEVDAALEDGVLRADDIHGSAHDFAVASGLLSTDGVDWSAAFAI